MSKINIGLSDGKPLFIDVDLLIPSRLLIQANSGGGKSYLLRRLMEALWKLKVQTIVIDPEGEFYTLREKFGYVLIGENGEAPADVRSAALLAEKFLQLKASAVCDLYEAFRSKPMQQRQWVRAFINALLDAPRSLWHPLVVIVDEAHKFCPQESPKAASNIDREIIGGCKDAMIALSTTGRKRGFCPIWATQRLAKLDKDASAEFFNRMVGMTIEDVDVDRAADLMSVSKADKPEFRTSLRNLTPGEFYCFGRAITTVRKLVKVGSVETHHPETGIAAKTAVAPPTPEEVKKFLPQLSDLPKQAEDKARSEAELKRDLAEARRQLAVATKASPVATKSVPDPRVIERAVKAATDPLVKQLNLTKQRMQNLLGKSSVEAAKVVELLQAGLRDISAVELPVVSVALPVSPTRPSPSLLPARVPRSSLPPGEALPLGTMARQIAGILAAYHPNPVKRSILAAMCGVVDGGNFSGRLSEVRSNGLLEEPGRGLLLASPTCVSEFLGVFDPPRTTEQVMALWDKKLGNLAQQILRKLVEANGEPIRRADLAADLGLVDGGNFSGRLSEVRSTGLMLEPGRGLLAANKEALFLNGAAA